MHFLSFLSFFRSGGQRGVGPGPSSPRRLRAGSRPLISLTFCKPHLTLSIYAQCAARGAAVDTYLRGVRHEVVEQRLHGGARAGRQQLLGLRHDVLGNVSAAQELCYLLAEVIAVVLQQVIR